MKEHIDTLPPPSQQQQKKKNKKKKSTIEHEELTPVCIYQPATCLCQK